MTHFRSPRGLVRAVDGVTLSVERGQAVGIVGESGAGKTVLARSIMGLISDAEAERRGSVRFRGEELAPPPRSADALDLGSIDGDGVPGPDGLAQPADARG